MYFGRNAPDPDVFFMLTKEEIGENEFLFCWK
jgi:hypothetical protein